MTGISTLLCASLLLIAPTAMAQTYGISSQMTGEARSSAEYGQDGDSFPDYSAAQIAADVTTQFNARTGEKEYLAPTFDPFEAEDDLAGTVRLRSTDGTRDLNNEPLTDGALLDVSLFYTDQGDRQFGMTRDAVFLNGDPVPITLRDGRELECSARVTERIYQYDREYIGIPLWTRPHYYGHRGFSYGGFGYDRYRARRYRDRARDHGVVRPRRHPGGRPTVDPRREPTPRTNDRPRPRRVDPNDPYIPPQITNGEQTRRPRPRPRRDETRIPASVAPDVRGLPGSPRVRPQADRARDTRREPRLERRATPRPETRSPAPRAEPRPQRRARPAPIKRVEPRSRLRDPSASTRIQHDMFPGDGYDGTVIVSSERDCAREDQLTLFIPNERLIAGRFDGLTLIIRDVTYDPRSGQTTVYNERPLFIPPNYIEGYRLSHETS